MKRAGFGLIQALLVIVLVGGLMSVVIRYAKFSVKQTKDLYVKESGELFMNSAVELSLLAIENYKRDNTNGCLSSVSITSADKRFTADINITDYYLYDTNSSSDDYDICLNSQNGYKVHKIDTEDSHGMVMLEIVVEANQTHPKNHNTYIKLLRRTLQRP